MDCKPILQSVLIGFIFVSSVFSKDFKIYWNLPSSKCQDFGTPAINATQYGIIQNENDAFLGNQIAVLDDPGDFPAILKDPETGDVTYRNKGVPQEGNLHDHLEKFYRDVHNLIPHQNYSGIAVIRYDAWRPIFVQNNGKFEIYKNHSRSIYSKPNSTQVRINFESHARDFLVSTLTHAKQLRPKAKWGYYGLPLCVDYHGNYTESCTNSVVNDNDKLAYLIKYSDVIVPSANLIETLPYKEQISIILEQINAALRLVYRVPNKSKPKVLLYLNSNLSGNCDFISGVKYTEALDAIKYSRADGVILSASPNNFDNTGKCNQFRSHLKQSLGPSTQYVLSKAN